MFARVRVLGCRTGAATAQTLIVLPVPWHTVQTAGMQVWAFPSQVRPGACTRAPLWHAGQIVQFMIAPMPVTSHLEAFTL